MRRCAATSRGSTRKRGRASNGAATFMGEELGIRLKPEVLPFSNIPAYLTPFILSPGRAMAMMP